MDQLQTELDGRVLRFDGVSIIDPDQVLEAIRRGLKPSALRVTELTAEIKSFNREVSDAEALKECSKEPINIDLTWILPQKYLTIDLWDHIISVFGERLKDLEYNDAELHEATCRIEAELLEVHARGMTEFMKTIIYVLDVFRAKNVIWGVGRGSSCASYILFILGLHVVDCVKFAVPMEEFFH